MGAELIDGLELNYLKIINHEKGNIFHILKESDNSFKGFGEVYMSSVKRGDIKGWKKHYKMTCNFVVPFGKIKLVIFDDRKDSKTYSQFNEFFLSRENYIRLTIPPGLWYSFQGIKTFNYLINVANLAHDPNEQTNLEINNFKYNWKK